LATDSHGQQRVAGSNPAARAIPIRETCAPSVLKMLRAYAGFFTQAMSAALLTD
jgi:hypothetical protein